MPAPLAQRRFTIADQLRFAALSGDRNPMHLDKLAARRTQAGVPAVHGLHLLMWALDRLAETTPGIAAITRLRVAFDKFVQLDDPTELWLAQNDAAGFKIDICVHGVALARVVGQVGTLAAAVEMGASGPAVWPSGQAAEPGFDTLEDQHGRVALGPITAGITAFFPHAVAAWGVPRMAALVGTTTLVGMICPGLHSIFGGLTLTMTDDDARDTLDWRVGAFDPRFRRVRLDVTGPGLSGTIACFSRVPPVLQPAIADLASHIAPDAFAGSVALVIGGSRGLGELAAKLLAAGGAHVLISYAVGEAEARHVAAEITAWGGFCTILGYDVRQPAAAQLSGPALSANAPTHVYYFATPSISRGKAGLFDPARLAEFTQFYVTGFYDLVTHVRPQAAFYPSSTAIAAHPKEMTEYAMAKAAGELLCDDIIAYTEIRIVVSRLPRLPTDLTASITPAETADPIAVMVPLLKEVQGLSK